MVFIQRLYAAGLSSRTIAELMPCVDSPSEQNSDEAWERMGRSETGSPPHQGTHRAGTPSTGSSTPTAGTTRTPPPPVERPRAAVTPHDHRPARKGGDTPTRTGADGQCPAPGTERPFPHQQHFIIWARQAVQIVPDNDFCPRDHAYARPVRAGGPGGRTGSTCPRRPDRSPSNSRWSTGSTRAWRSCASRPGSSPARATGGPPPGRPPGWWSGTRWCTAPPASCATLDAEEEGLVFGRLDFDDGETYHIGRLGVRDEDREPLLIDWRAPAAAAFYRATSGEPHGGGPSPRDHLPRP